ncbi:MAG TPA: SGNH/GDSL hydrolase family protein [Puia sp.]|jgi:hypothetical protein|nr:SGNH/GDSL hydrolase family protein [Puia sp.]
MKKLLIFFIPVFLVIAVHGQDAGKAAIEQQINDSIRVNGVRAITAKTLNATMHAINLLNMDSTQVLNTINAQIGLSIPNLAGGQVPLSQLPSFLDTIYISNDTLHYSIHHLPFFQILPSGGGGGGIPPSDTLNLSHRIDTVGLDVALAEMGVIDTGASLRNALVDSAASLRGLISSGFDSATSQGGGFHTDGFNVAKYKQITDSGVSKPSNYVTQASKQKLSDSLQAIFNALLVLKKNISDSAATSPGGYTTQASRQKVSDSLQAIFNAALALKKAINDSIATDPGGYVTQASRQKVVDSILAVVNALLAAKAPLASPSFTGNPTVPTQTAHDSTTKAANDLYVDRAVAQGIAGIPPFNIYAKRGVFMDGLNLIALGSPFGHWDSTVYQNLGNTAGATNAQYILDSVGTGMLLRGLTWATPAGSLLVQDADSSVRKVALGANLAIVNGALSASGGTLLNRGMGNAGAIPLATPGTDSIKTVVAGSGLNADTTSKPGSIILNVNQTTQAAFYYNPKDIPGLVCWYDFQDQSTLAVNASGSASRITQVNDKSGNNYNLTQSDTTKSPTVVYYGGPNDLPYVSISNATMAVSGGIALSQPYTVYIVVQGVTYGNHLNLFQFGSSSTNGIAYTGPDTRGRYTLCAVASVDWKTQDVMNARSTWQIFKLVFNGTNSSVEVNEELKNIYYYLGTNNPGTGAMTAFNMGLTTSGGGCNYNIEECIVVSGIPKDADDKSVRDYLQTKYGLANNDFLAGFGNSIMAGYGLGNADSCFLYFIADTLGKDYFNYGIAGTKVVTPPNAFATTSSYMRGANNGWVLLEYGTNDYCVSNATTWKLDYEAQINKLINYGYSRSKIIIMSPPYHSAQTCQAGMAGPSGTLSQIATDLGITFADVWTYTQSIGTSGCPMQADNIHPTGACDYAIARWIIAQGYVH